VLDRVSANLAFSVCILSALHPHAAGPDGMDPRLHADQH
jgi:hypothetical protein